MLLFSFEGLDGSGKSTQAEQLRIRLEDIGYNVVAVREPGGTELSERIRALLLSASSNIDPYAELLLFSAARAQLVRSVIEPALLRGSVVICDRFFDSTSAYQGGGRRIESVEWMTDFHRHVTGGVIPHRTYYVRVPVDEAQRRRQSRSVGSDRMEDAGVEFFTRVAAAYEDLIKAEQQRFVVLEGTKTVHELADEVWADAHRLLTRAEEPPI